MTRKTLTVLLLAQLLCNSTLLAQLEQPTVSGLPNMLPPTPEAFALGKFGNNPIGLFTGAVQYAVPLYQINTGSISFPISVSYSSNGVKVDEVASRVGLQWKMDFGGVINRTVHGMPDETAQMRTTSHDRDSWAFYNFMSAAGGAPTSWDIQPDEYSYSFPGFSGKFFIKDGQIISVPVTSVRIEKSSGVFTITSPDGTKYYFGESNAYDESRTISAPVYCHSDAYNPGFTTAWYLTRIVKRTGETVTFVYDAVNGPGVEIEYPTGISQTFSFTPPPSSFTLFSCQVPGLPLMTCYQTVGFYGVKLKEIQFAQGKVRLTYSSREDVPGEKKLDSLIVENAEGLPIKKCTFSYAYSNHTSTTYDALIPGYSSVQSAYPEIRKRLFLTEVKDCTISGENNNKYLFEYDDYAALPPRLSFAQDYWGFFNGKQNELFFPNYTFAHLYLDNFPSVGADRTANSNYGKKGMLKKITYPTGGTTNYTYESNETNAGYILLKPLYDTVSFSGNLGKPPVPFTSSTFPINQGVYHVLVESSAAVDPPNPLDPFQYDSALHVRLTDQYSNVYIDNWVPIRAGYTFFNKYMAYADREFTLLLESDYPNVHYTVTILSEDPSVPPAQYTQVSGVRVAEVYDEDGLGNIQNHRVFKYHKWETPEMSSGLSLNEFTWNDFYSVVRTIGNTIHYTNIQCSYVQLQSNSQYSLYRNSLGTVNYSHVMEMTKDKTGALTGGTEHKFLVQTQTEPIKWGPIDDTHVEDFSGVFVPGCPGSNTDLFNGAELETKVFTLSGPSSRTVRQHTKNFFSVDSRRVTIDTVYALRKVKSREEYALEWRYVNDYDVNRYFVYSKWQHLDSTIATTYTATGDSMVSKVQYEYWNANHLMPSVVKTWDSKKDPRLVKKKYPGDIDTLPGPTYVTLTGDDTTEAVRERFYKDTDFLFTNYTKYKSWGGNVIQPEYSEVAGASETMSRVDFHDYTTRAKLKEVSKAGDVRISYIWDTIYNYLLAEVQNASVADIAFTGFESASQGTWSYNNSYRDASNYITGSKGFNLSSGNITRSSLSSAKTYFVSLWTTGSVTVSGTVSSVTGRIHGSWTHYTYKVTGVTSITISGSGYVDEVRLYPEGAQMKSHCYKLLTGVSTVCDANNRMSFYEYDAAGRLSVIRDQDGYVLKKFEYKYQSAQ